MGMKLTTLKDDHRMKLVEWFARGYTVRQVRINLAQLLNVPAEQIGESDLLKLGILYSENIQQVRIELDTLIRQTGLVSKEERLRRLNDLAESWEERAQTGDKAASVYLKTLDQIRGEIEPVGGLGLPEKQNPWYLLLSELVAQTKSSPQPSQLPAQTLVTEAPTANAT
jgi:hypothetical protein